MGQKLTPEALAVRRQAALDLRIDGWSYRAIAKELGIGHSQAKRDVQAELEALVEESREAAEEVRELELSRLDKAITVCNDTLKSCWVDGSDDREKSRELQLKAIDRIAKLTEQRAKLLGLYAPQEVKQTITDEVSPQKIRDVVQARFGSKAAPRIEDDGSGPPDNSDS